MTEAEGTAYFCCECERWYPDAEWEKILVWDDDMPNWLDSVRGRCPAGHERMLED